MTTLIERWFPYAWDLREQFVEATWETIYMVLIACLVGGLLGLILGVIATVTRPSGLFANRGIYKVLDNFINVFRSIPFIILLALVSGFTRFIVGTTIGATAASVPIVIGTIPFFARQVQIALLEVDPGMIEAAQAMGLSPLDIILRVYLKEGLPALLRVSASTLISVINLTAMAGAVGGGGLGTMAIARGYQRSRMDVILVSTALILLLVFLTQVIFNYLIKKVEK